MLCSGVSLFDWLEYSGITAEKPFFRDQIVGLVDAFRVTESDRIHSAADFERSLDAGCADFDILFR